jgi:hypothetical protein
VFYTERSTRIRTRFTRRPANFHEAAGDSENNGIIEKNQPERAGGYSSVSPTSWTSQSTLDLCCAVLFMLANTCTLRGPSRWFRRFPTNLPDNACHLDAVSLTCLRPRKQIPQGKWDPVMRAGIFAGYRMRPGWHRKDEYLVWDMTDFALRLSSTHPALGTRLNSPHVTCRVHLHEGRLTFPLKAEYERANSTLEGIRASQGMLPDPERPWRCVQTPTDERTMTPEPAAMEVPSGSSTMVESTR